MAAPAFDALEAIKAIPSVLQDNPGEAVAALIWFVGFLLLRRVGTSENGGGGRIFW